MIHKPSRMKKFPSFEFTQNSDGYPVIDHNEKLILPPVAKTDLFVTSVAAMEEADLPF